MAPELLCRNTMPSAFAFILREAKTSHDNSSAGHADTETSVEGEDFVQHKVRVYSAALVYRYIGNDTYIYIIYIYQANQPCECEHLLRDFWTLFNPILRYAAPGSHMHAHMTTQVDVYSYAIVVWELLNARRAYEQYGRKTETWS